LEESCPGAKFRDDDIKKLVDAGYDTETALLRVPTSLIKETLSGFVEQVSTLNIPVFQSYNARYFGKLQ
jgi:hypothetical protein